MFLLVSGGHIGVPERDTNISHLKYFTDLILGKGFCIFIVFHFPDSSPSVLNGVHFYFSLRDSASREFSSILMRKGPFCPPASSRETASDPSPLNDGNWRRLG